jgi:peroxiredoxin
MLATLCLISCVFVPAQPPPSQPADRPIGPRLVKAEEFIYHGTYDEESVRERVRFSRSYRVDTRMFVLDTLPIGADVAVMTVLRPKDANAAPIPPGISGDTAASSARLEVIRVDLQGHVSGDAEAALSVPLDGPPSVETGAFVELPSARTADAGIWTVAEPGRPPQTWQRKGSELVNGTSCLKLVAEQQSNDWDKHRVDRASWRRSDTVWIASRLGVAFRVERIIECRDVGATETTHKHVLRYELDSSLRYPGQLSDERRLEINRAKAFSEAASPLVANPVQSARQLASLLNRINLHLEHEPATPYREAILHVRRQLEAARRGETPAIAARTTAEPPNVVTVGQTAPDFVASELTARQTTSARLRNWLGRPVLLVFYDPRSSTTAELMRFAKSLDSRFNGSLYVVGVSVSDDAEFVRRQQRELGFSFPVISGNGLRMSYAIEATPKIVLIDATGVVRGTYLGWGGETPSEVLTDLRQCSQRR